MKPSRCSSKAESGERKEGKATGRTDHLNVRRHLCVKETAAGEREPPSACVKHHERHLESHSDEL